MENPLEARDLRQIASAIEPWCEAKPELRLAVVFGSGAAATARPESDLDLALWVAPPPPPLARLRWAGELEDATGLPVQLVLVTSLLDPVLGFQIARQGVAVFERRAGHWPEERLRLWHLYQDSSPFLRAAREELRAFAEKVDRGA